MNHFGFCLQAHNNVFSNSSAQKRTSTCNRLEEMATDLLHEVLVSRDKRLVRPAWTPRWSNQPTGRPKATPQASKFGGVRPYRRPGFEWPQCQECDNKMDFLFQLEARSLPPKARELTTLKSGLLQVFNCVCCSFSGRDEEDVLQGMWVVPENELVPSLWSLAASALVATKTYLSALPDILTNMVKAHTDPSYHEEYPEEYPYPEDTEVAGWAESGFEVTRLEEVQLALQEEGLRTGEELDEGRVRPEELIAERHRDGLNEVKFPRQRYGRSYGYIKLGGWIRWFDEYVHYPKCPGGNPIK